MYVPTYAIVLIVGAIALLVMMLEVQIRAARASRREAVALRARVLELDSEAMAQEARERGVGGIGEHNTTVILPLDKVSREWTMARHPRFSIPNGGVGS